MTQTIEPDQDVCVCQAIGVTDQTTLLRSGIVEVGLIPGRHLIQESPPPNNMFNWSVFRG